MKKGEKILISVGGFFGKVAFLTGVTLKFYQKFKKSSPKSNLFSIVSKKYFAKKI